MKWNYINDRNHIYILIYIIYMIDGQMTEVEK